MFVYNAICVMRDQLTTKAGTITSGEDRFMEWKTKDGSYENTQFAQFDTFFEGIFQKDRLLDILKNFILFSNEKSLAYINYIYDTTHRCFARRTLARKHLLLLRREDTAGESERCLGRSTRHTPCPGPPCRHQLRLPSARIPTILLLHHSLQR